MRPRIAAGEQDREERDHADAPRTPATGRPARRSAGWQQPLHQPQPAAQRRGRGRRRRAPGRCAGAVEVVMLSPSSGGSPGQCATRPRSRSFLRSSRRREEAGRAERLLYPGRSRDLRPCTGPTRAGRETRGAVTRGPTLMNPDARAPAPPARLRPRRGRGRARARGPCAGGSATCARARVRGGARRPRGAAETTTRARLGCSDCLDEALEVGPALRARRPGPGGRPDRAPGPRHYL